MAGLKIVHVIEQFAGSGPERALLTGVKLAKKLGLPQRHEVLSLRAAGSPRSLLMARRLGIEVILGPAPETVRGRLDGADIVVVHYWNNPALDDFLRAGLPPVRLLVWSTVNGRTPPQIITEPLVGMADRFLVKTPGSLELAVLKNLGEKTAYLSSPLDPDRLERFAPIPHERFNVGYIGSVTPAKLHPEFVAMSAAAMIPKARFLVYGGGAQQALVEEAMACGVMDRFSFRGYTEEIAAALAELDVFGYPLHPETYATSELALREAMWVGIPPVVFPHGGVRFLVDHDQTGLVVSSAEDYTGSLERLAEDARLRRRLGGAARSYARGEFSPEPIVRRLAGIYDEMMALPKSPRSLGGKDLSPAERFAENLEERGLPFLASLHGEEADARQAEEAIFHSPAPLAVAEGGVFHYRNHYPDDPFLRLWAGLILERSGRTKAALQEYLAARERGLDPTRLFEYVRRAETRPAAAG